MTHTWHWSTWQDHPYLTTTLLADWPHGFFTQQSWPQTPETLTAGLASTPAVYRAKQVHGNVVLSPADFPAEGGPSEDGAIAGDRPRPEADGIITSDPQQAVWVCTADCTPALIADQRTGQAVAVHAGWRGTALNIVPIAVQKLQAQGSQLTDLRVALGPAISGEVYQVTTQVAAQVGRSLIADPQAADDDILTSLSQGPEAPILSDPQPGRARLDVRRVLACQLDHLGLRRDQVAIAPHCTYQEPDRFFSYRRSREKKVQWSGIVSQ
jgi:YfiH family protein